MDLYGEFLGGDEPDIYDVLRDLDQKKLLKIGNIVVNTQLVKKNSMKDL